MYTVKRIDEDLDFGCEERNGPVMAVVTLEDPDGNERIIRVPDQELYEKCVKENDQVDIGVNGTISKRIKLRLD